MNIILFDDPAIRPDLLPLTFVRPVAKIRVGILTIDEKWSRYLQAPVSFQTEDYLQQKFPTQISEDNLFINGAICPDANLINAINALEVSSALVHNNIILIARTPKGHIDNDSLKRIEYKDPITIIDQVWKVFSENAAQIRIDFELITRNRKSSSIDDPHTIVYGKQNIFIEEGVSLKAAVLNAEQGPIYLGKNSEVQEGALIKGPFALCEGSVVNMGAKMRGDTTIGPYSKIGGEVSNSVLFGYSNKGHDGFLGNSVVAEWCNLGADTNTSNLKNNYDNVKLWNYTKGSFKNTGLQFCGLIMGDHTKCGINTMFNTGTVTGIGSNIFGEGYPRNFIPSFAWGGSAGFTTYELEKFYDTTTRVMARRKLVLDDTEKEILRHVFEATANYRVWERRV